MLRRWLFFCCMILFVLALLVLLVGVPAGIVFWYCSFVTPVFFWLFASRTSAFPGTAVVIRVPIRVLPPRHYCLSSIH